MLMKKLKKAVLAAAAVCLVGTSAFAATPKETYIDALNYSGSHPEGAYALEVNASMPFAGEMKAHSDIYVQMRPFKVRSDSYATFMGNKGDVTSAYAEQDGNQLVCYYPRQEKDGKTTWYKASTTLQSDKPLADQLTVKVHPGALNGVKNVVQDGRNLHVTYDMSRVYQPGDEAKWPKEMQNKESVARVLTALRDSGDVTASLTLDPATNRIVSLRVPLTDQFHAVADTAVDLINAQAQKPRTDAEIGMIKQFIKNSTVLFDESWRELPADVNLSVPADVKTKAQVAKDSKALVWAGKADASSSQKQ